MGFNKKVLSKAVSELDKAKAPTKPRDITVDPMGYWNPANQGQPVRIPGNNITMQGVPYPVWAQPNVGPGSMMQPNQDYNFPGASYVDETPMAKKGGTLQSKKYSKSMSATNKLFAKNKLFQNKKSKIFDPNAEFKNGGESNYEDLELTDEEIQAYRDGGYVVEELLEAQEGGPQNTAGPRAEEISTNVDAMNAMMKARMATDAAFGNPAAQRMISPNPKTYDFGNGDLGTHFMASMGNQAVPLLQDKGGNELEYNENPPPSNEDMNFRTPEEAQYFAEHYKEVAPMMKGFKKGGYVQHELVKAQNGKTVKPLLISDPKEYAYRNKMYADSLSAYNSNPPPYNSYENYKKSMLNEYNMAHMISGYGVEKPINKDTKYPNFKSKPVNSVEFTMTAPKLDPKSLKVVGRKKLYTKTIPVYKKPVQPVVYWNKDNVINKTLTSLPANPTIQESNKVNVLPPRAIQQFTNPSTELQPTNFQTKPKKPQGPRYGTLAGDELLNLPKNYTQQQREAARKKRDSDEFTRKTLEYQAKQRGTKAPIAQMFQKGGDVESWEDELDDNEIKALEAAGYTIERIK